MIRRQLLYVLAAMIAVVLIVAGIGISRALANFGMSPAQAFGVFHKLRADAIAVRDAEGPIDTPNGIAERGFVKIGGIDQWVTIRGEDRRNPAILIVHGGVGDAQSQLAYLYRHWQRDFTVVQWDQRGAGRTYGRYGDATPDMTLERMIQDGVEVADYARKRLDQRKLILLGHSWGSALGVHIIQRRPDLFSAYVGTGQVVRVADLTARQYDYTLERLRADHQKTAIAELLKLGPPPYKTDAQEEVMRTWLNRYLADSDKNYLLASVDVMLRNSKYSLKDFRDLQTGHLSFSLPRMYLTYTAIDLNSLGVVMPIPFFIIDGREDHLAPPDLASQYFQTIRAPQKAMFLLDNAGHFAAMSNSDEFLKILVDRVRPVVLSETTGAPAPKASAL
jgi:pimeloyl-ACP methyl ester carboxylesterase